MEPIVGDLSLVASEVEVISVDEFVARHALTGVDLVKLDTEGTEDSVFAGMVRTIEEHRPTFFCEVLPGGPAEAIENILAPFDYRFYLLSDAGVQPCAHIEPHHTWRNHLFRPAEGRLDRS